jgi:serine protease Do
MPIVIRLFAWLVVLCAAIATTPAVADPADIAATSRSVVRVVLIGEENGEPTLVGHGSGFAVAPNVILTNAHVIEPSQQQDGIRIGVVPSQGKGGWFARVIAFAPKSDLALIKLIEKGSLPPVTMFTGPVADGGAVVAVGYPGNVDVAQGLNVGDIVSPTSPVKTQGNVSTGRSSKSFETILHTAPIGAGNSGGPLLDPCGRVIGVNTFGTVSQDGDSEFYFAVSVGEVLRFVRASGITPGISGIACRSLADLDREEAERLAGEKIDSDEAARLAAASRHDRSERAERTALFDVIAERENGLALATLALLLALAAGGGAFVFSDRARAREAKVAGGMAGVLVLAAGAAWMLRPGFAQVDERARAIAAAPAHAKAAAGISRATGDFVCTIDQARSRITVSDPADVRLSWTKDGCADGKRQFGPGNAGWASVSAPDERDGVTVATFDPARGSYRAERYLLDLDTLTRFNQERARLATPACGGGEAGKLKAAEAQAALAAVLPPAPNERLMYNCRDTKAAN